MMMNTKIHTCFENLPVCFTYIATKIDNRKIQLDSKKFQLLKNKTKFHFYIFNDIVVLFFIRTHLFVKKKNVSNGYVYV